MCGRMSMCPIEPSYAWLWGEPSCSWKGREQRVRSKRLKARQANPACRSRLQQELMHEPAPNRVPGARQLCMCAAHPCSPALHAITYILLVMRQLALCVCCLPSLTSTACNPVDPARADAASPVCMLSALAQPRRPPQPTHPSDLSCPAVMGKAAPEQHLNSTRHRNPLCPARAAPPGCARCMCPACPAGAQPAQAPVPPGAAVLHHRLPQPAVPLEPPPGRLRMGALRLMAWVC